ncbi:hypothetical protein QQF64_035622 [Cirrhinus molitorella]|uniref:Uncharacterized protein n=1 Tax=Cirrhinus molitorella TaxID=172907 RepID=A0ABR3NGA5_9TELE
MHTLRDRLVCGLRCEGTQKRGVYHLESLRLHPCFSERKDKCEFFQSAVEYLDHVIDASGLHISPSKVKAIVDAPMPKNVSQLRSFLLLLNYYGWFIPNIATLLKPLHKLLCHENSWRWTTERQETFKTAKETLLKSKALTHFALPFRFSWPVPLSHMVWELSCPTSFPMVNPLGSKTALARFGPVKDKMLLVVIDVHTEVAIMKSTSADKTIENTLHTTTKVSPAYLLFNRELRTSFKLLKPATLKETVLQQQQNQVQRRKLRAKDRTFSTSSSVLARNYGSGPKWVPATVETQTGPVSYKVKTAGNLLWRRHTDQLLSGTSTFTELPEGTDVADQEDVSSPASVTGTTEPTKTPYSPSTKELSFPVVSTENGNQVGRRYPDLVPLEVVAEKRMMPLNDMFVALRILAGDCQFDSYPMPRVDELLDRLGRAWTINTQKRTCPVLSLQPIRGLVDKKFQIVVMNLPPNQKVTLHSLHQSDDKDFWEAFGHYVSDEHGSVTGVKDESLGGTYEGIEPMGLMWSMRPIPGSRHGLRLRKRDIFTPMVAHISVYSGHLSQGFSQQTPLATSVTERWYIAPGVKRVSIRDKVRGTLFLPPGPGPYPGVLDLWGAGGGLVEYRSALLASHGFASMALEYLTPENLRLEDINASYFEIAYQILKNHPLVQKDHLAVLGLSLGGIITLSMVAYSEVIKPQCCVCISGSHLMPFDKSFSEFFKKMEKHADKIHVNEDNQVIYRDLILSLSHQSSKVDVGRIKCPLLLLNGDDDQVIPTVESAEDMKMMMEKAGNRHLLKILTYPDAGHLIEPPYSPHFRATNFYQLWTKERIVMLWGGQTKPHAYAQEDAWKKILAFLRQHLSAPVTLF